MINQMEYKEYRKVKDTRVRCHWCQELVEPDVVNSFMLYDKRLKDITEKYLCRECQYLFDKCDTSQITKIRKKSL